MPELLDKLKRSRESSIQTGGHTFTVRRPTEMEVVRANGISADFALRFVVGWDLKESDIVPGGNPEPAQFSEALYLAWIEDRPDLWKDIASGVVDLYVNHRKEAEQRGKD